MNTAHLGFPTSAGDDELNNDRDTYLGKVTAGYLHPEISTYICNLKRELNLRQQTFNTGRTKGDGIGRDLGKG
jgi:hypothetical protein